VRVKPKIKTGFEQGIITDPGLVIRHHGFQNSPVSLQDVIDGPDVLVGIAIYAVIVRITTFVAAKFFVGSSS
jgi:hypothetical protein